MPPIIAKFARMKDFIDIFCENYGLDKPDTDFLIREMQHTQFRKGEVIVPYGSFNDSFYILEDGIWSCSRPKEAGEVVVWFAFKGEAVTNVICYNAQRPSRVNIISETDSQALWISKNRLNTLCLSSLNISNIIRKIFEVHSCRFESDVVWMAEKPDSTKRYLALIKDHPDLIRDVPLKKIASYLWITPQSLSRIRANIDKRQ